MLSYRHRKSVLCPSTYASGPPLSIETTPFLILQLSLSSSAVLFPHLLALYVRHCVLFPSAIYAHTLSVLNSIGQLPASFPPVGKSPSSPFYWCLVTLPSHLRYYLLRCLCVPLFLPPSSIFPLLLSIHVGICPCFFARYPFFLQLFNWSPMPFLTLNLHLQSDANKHYYE